MQWGSRLECDGAVGWSRYAMREIISMIINRAIKAVERSKIVAPISEIIHDNASVNSELGPYFYFSYALQIVGKTIKVYCLHSVYFQKSF